MKKILLSFSIFFFSFYSYSQNTASLDAQGNSDLKISRHIYGHFAEHLGRNIYGGFYVGEDNTNIPHTNGVAMML